MQEMYTMRFKPAADVKDKWDLFTMSAPVPACKPEPRSDRADARGQQLHDAGVACLTPDPLPEGGGLQPVLAGSVKRGLA